MGERKRKLCIETGLLTVAIFIVTFTVLYFKFDIFWGISLGVSVAVLLLVSWPIYASATFRCVMGISIIKLVGPQCRVVLIAIVSGVLIGGPLLSIIHNLHQVQETTECVANMVQAHSEEVRDAYTTAYRDISDKIEESVEVWKNVGQNIENVIAPVRNTFATAANAIKDIERKLRSVQDNCGRSIDEVRNKCESGTRKAYGDCLAIVPSIQNTIKKPITDVVQTIPGGATDVVTTVQDRVQSTVDKFKGFFGKKRRKRSTPLDLQNICQPVNLGASTCSMFRADVVCSPLKGVTISALPSIAEELGRFANMFSLSVEPKTNLDQNISSTVGNFPEKIKEIRGDFQEAFSVITVIFQVIQGLLTIPLLVVPLLSFLYLRGARKALLNGGNVTIDKFFGKDAKKERRGALNHFLLLVTHMLLSVCIFSFDFLLYYTQSVARDYGGANVTATGALEIDIDVKAGPILQPIVDTFIKTLTHEQSYSVDLSSEKCLPDPLPSADTKAIVFVVILYLVMILSFLFQAFLGPLKKRVVLGFLIEPGTNVREEGANFRNDYHTNEKGIFNSSSDKGKTNKINQEHNEKLASSEIPNKNVKLMVNEINELNKHLNSGY